MDFRWYFMYPASILYEALLASHACTAVFYSALLKRRLTLRFAMKIVTGAASHTMKIVSIRRKNLDKLTLQFAHIIIFSTSVRRNDDPIKNHSPVH